MKEKEQKWRKLLAYLLFSISTGSIRWCARTETIRRFRQLMHHLNLKIPSQTYKGSDVEILS